ncbi:MAG: hypothetical protein ACTS73_01235 [Arsenophonus sp. NEOnobi-MAG3]
MASFLLNLSLASSIAAGYFAEKLVNKISMALLAASHLSVI